MTPEMKYEIEDKFIVVAHLVLTSYYVPFFDVCNKKVEHSVILYENGKGKRKIKIYNKKRIAKKNKQYINYVYPWLNGVPIDDIPSFSDVYSGKEKAYSNL